MTIEDRVSRLERSARRWRNFSILLIAVSAVALLCAAEAVPDELVAKKLRIVNDTGGTTAVLTSQDSRGVLYVLGNNQSMAAVVGAGPKGGTLLLGYGAGRGQNGVTMAATEGVGGSIIVSKPTGKSGLMIWPENDQGNIAIYGPDGAKTWAAP